MIQERIRWVRDYLAARDLDTEVAGGLAVERLPDPLPTSVRAAAFYGFVTFNVVLMFGVLYVVIAGASVVIMPIVMGREGVGTAMITLFTVCVTAVGTAVALLATRSAARVLRRERSGVQSLKWFASAGALFCVIAFAMTFAADLMMNGADDPDVPSFVYVIMAQRGFAVIIFCLYVWIVLTMRTYARTLPSR